MQKILKVSSDLSVIDIHDTVNNLKITNDGHESYVNKEIFTQL